MGFDFTPSEGVDASDPTAYFADYRNQRKVWLASRAGFDAVEDDEGVVQLVEREATEKVGRGQRVIAERRRIEVSDLGISPKKLVTACEALGWNVSIWLTVTDVDPVYYVNDSEEKSAKQHSAGDVRYEGYIARNYAVEARFGQHPVGFQAFFMGKGEEGKTAGFEWCRVRDSAIGIVVENFVDYTRTPDEAAEKGWDEQKRLDEAERMNARYNDPPFRREHIKHYHSAGDLNGWLDSWLDALKIEAKRLTVVRKPKQSELPAEEREAALISGEDWNG